MPEPNLYRTLHFEHLCVRFRRICLARLQILFTPRSLVACQQAMRDV